MTEEEARGIMAALPDLGCILNTKCNLSRTIHSINVSTFTHFGVNYVIKLTKQGTRLPKPNDVPSRDYPVSTVSSVMVSVLMPVHRASTIAYVLWAQDVAKGMDLTRSICWMSHSSYRWVQVRHADQLSLTSPKQKQQRRQAARQQRRRSGPRARSRTRPSTLSISIKPPTTVSWRRFPPSNSSARASSLSVSG